MKQAKDLMSANFPCCTPEHSVQQAAEVMVKHDCGEIAVVETEENLKPIGLITDRDIACRVVAAGKSPGSTNPLRYCGIVQSAEKFADLSQRFVSHLPDHPHGYIEEPSTTVCNLVVPAKPVRNLTW